MIIRDDKLKIFADINNVVLNNMTENPFRFPRPQDVEAAIVVGGYKKPNVNFDNSLKYVFDRCLRSLLLYFKQNMVETFEDLRRGDDTVSITNFKCGTRKVSRNVYIGIWAFRCSLLAKNPNLTVEDFQLYADSPDGFEKDFTLFIESGEIKPRQSTDNPAKISKAQLGRNNTRD
jgi:hypothetical protein